MLGHDEFSRWLGEFSDLDSGWKIEYYTGTRMDTGFARNVILNFPFFRNLARVRRVLGDMCL